MDNSAPTVKTAKQRMVDQGELTPFHSMPGVEKEFRRVSRTQLPTPSPTPSSSRPRPAAPPPVRTALSSQPRSVRKPTTSRSRAPPRSSTPTLQAPVVSKRQRGSVTPPPVLRESKSPVSSDVSVASEWSADELPRRLTRARMRQEERSVEEAVRRSEREASGAKAEYEEEEADEDVQLIEEDSVKEDGEDEEEEVKDQREDDEWQGDAESSAEEDDEDADDRPSKRSTGSTTRRGGARRRLMRPKDFEAEEVAEGEEEQLLDDDNDDDLTADVYSGPSSSSRRTAMIVDDFFDWQYEERVSAYRDSKQFVNEVRRVEGRPQESKEDESDESSLDVAFDGGFVLPGRIWDRLFGYQKTSIKWMWELHCQNVGGVIADEMGLGKTIQMVAFLAGLHYSNALHVAKHGASSPSPFQLPPTLILSPATILTQWLRELHSWYPELRILVLHDSVQAHHGQSKETVVAKLFQSAHVLVTTYECCRIYQHLLLGREWGYVSDQQSHMSNCWHQLNYYNLMPSSLTLFCAGSTPGCARRGSSYPQSRRCYHFGVQAAAVRSPHDTDRRSHTEQPRRTVVAVRLRVPRQAGHAARVRRRVRVAHQPGRLHQRLTRPSTSRLPLRQCAERAHQPLRTAEKQSGRGTAPAHKDRAGAVREPE